MARYFEKITLKQFSKDCGYDRILYNTYALPKRGTRYSAGYDFISIKDLVIKPKEVVKIPTGIKVVMNDDEVLNLYVRSSMGFKYNVRMCNQVGIVDKDYYNNCNNEGHIWIKLQNEGD